MILNFAHICKYLSCKQVQELQLVEKLWYQKLVQTVFTTCQVRFEVEDIFARPLIVQYYEGCLMVIDVGSCTDE